MSKKALQEKEKQEKELMEANSNLEFKGNEEADASDILVPRILLMQGTSKWVPDEFSMGDLINSVEETLLAKKGETLTIIPFLMKKTWENFTDEKNPQWKGADQWTAANDAWPWRYQKEDAEAGMVDMKRQRQYNFYCFVVGEDGISEYDLPASIAFRSSAGFKEGKKVASHFGVMKARNLPGFTVTWDIKTETVKDGDNSYMKYIVKRGRNVTADETEVVKQWLTLMQTKTVVEDTDEVKAAPVVNHVPPPSEAPVPAEADY